MRLALIKNEVYKVYLDANIENVCGLEGYLGATKTEKGALELVQTTKMLWRLVPGAFWKEKKEAKRNEIHYTTRVALQKSKDGSTIDVAAIVGLFGADVEEDAALLKSPDARAAPSFALASSSKHKKRAKISRSTSVNDYFLRRYVTEGDILHFGFRQDMLDVLITTYSHGNLATQMEDNYDPSTYPPSFPTAEYFRQRCDGAVPETDKYPPEHEDIPVPPPAPRVQALIDPSITAANILAASMGQASRGRAAVTDERVQAKILVCLQQLSTAFLRQNKNGSTRLLHDVTDGFHTLKQAAVNDTSLLMQIGCTLVCMESDPAKCSRITLDANVDFSETCQLPGIFLRHWIDEQVIWGVPCPVRRVTGSDGSASD